MSINAYLRPLIRWWRLIVIVTVLAVSASAISTMFQADVYVSKTTLITGTTFLDPNPEFGQLSIAQQLSQIYADMASREPIQAATMEALGIDWLPPYQARVIPNTQLVEISVSDTNPQRAQIIASEIARQLLMQSPTIGGTETGASQEFITAQLDSLKVQIEDTQQSIEELQKNLVGLTSASQIADIELEIVEQTSKLNSLRTSYANFLANSQGGATNILSVLEPANMPARPTSSNKLNIIFLAGMVGLSLGVGAAYLLEYLDNTIKTTSDVERIFDLPVIGYISEIPAQENRATYISKYPDSLVAENFRMLWSNIDFFRIENSLKTILITSPSQGNGKTTVSINLALAISQVEDDVVLVDADLRRPAVHELLKISKSPGLSDVIRRKEDIQSVIQNKNTTGSLKVVAAGRKPPNVTQVVGSTRIAAILSELKENHDLIIVDAPPLIISDSYNLASRVDGVIIVIELDQLSDDQARAIKEQLDRANANVLGIVFNKLSEANIRSYGDHQYQSLYSSQYYSDYIWNERPEPATPSQSKKLIDFFEWGKVPSEVDSGVENAINAIKTQPRVILNRLRKLQGNGKTDQKAKAKEKKKDKQ